MIKDSVTVDDVIELLNDAFAKDPEAMNQLAQARVVCNDALADHSTIQVGQFGGEYKVGIIGILNGIFGINDRGWGVISGDFEVICPNGHELPDKISTISKCPTCNESVVSKLTGFRRLRGD